MKKSAILAAVLTLFVASAALAEEEHATANHEHAASHHRLLVTDVPDPGEVEVRGDYIYSYAEGKNELDEKVKDEASQGVLFLGAGVVKGLKLSASLPYTFAQHAENQKKQGFGDLTLGARFNPSRAHLVELPVELAVGLDWQLNSASTSPSKPGFGGNVYSPYLAVSKEIGMAIPYAKYQADVVVKSHADQTVHNLTAGAELELCHRASLDASVKVSFNGSTESAKSSTDVELELMPYLNIAKNTYLLPRVAYRFIGDVEDPAGVKVLKDAGEFKTGLGLYVLF
jgi:hypothetical protein